MSAPILTTQRLRRVVPPQRVLIEGLSLSFLQGAKIGVLGINGSGKSTLLRILAGVDHDFEGELRFQPGTRIGYLPQEPELDPDKTVRESVEAGLSGIRELIQKFESVSQSLGEPLTPEAMDTLLTEQAALQDAIEHQDGWNWQHHLDIASEALRLPDPEARVGTLSGGERRRVALCRTLLAQPDLLLLDEPTNHLDVESVAWLEKTLREYPGTVILVTHDRYFLDNVAGWILEIDRGQGIPFEGNYSAWLEQKEARLAQETREQAAYRRSLQDELAWIRQGSRGRQAKSKARIKRYEELSSREFQKQQETRELYIPPGPRLGEVVIDVQSVSKSYGTRKLLDHLSFRVERGAIVGILGPNGAGKSTLLRLITGQEKPDHGQIIRGETTRIAYVDQLREGLDENQTVWQYIADGQDRLIVGGFEMASRAYVGRFNFRGPDQQKPLGRLAGGERNRVHLARLLREGGNVLLLDEPTNDLDVETLRALEEALLAFPGSVLVTSHDRWFLNRIATHILAFEGPGQVIFEEGDYSEYETRRETRVGTAPMGSRRMRHS
jgi:ATP-binding cassette ChvD family protein